MRRKDRELDINEAYKVIDESEYSVVSCIDEDSVFSVPISHVRENNSIFLHGAMAGGKKRLFQNGKDVELVCVSQNNIPMLSPDELEMMKGDGKAYSSKAYTTKYKSAVAKTKAYQVDDEVAKIHALRLLCEKYTPKYLQGFDAAIAHSLKTTNVYELKIISLSAKTNIKAD
ncbi:pyridoxamine 5'-phosphate oxidase family protein [Campylobacter sp. faydin G-24]|uniref:Pyridoxamine 5'-phosphate oxidase family protein n=1 Tax=Campylobacter anatolicus TaxID=2829105 RepID=A0ABS5HIX3_9BACT|nr:pyridoxamine 5'-phosphate oxidase family protein [Campylobacter anatolicus]MBR8464224.1 pyridoxamine 5'-phosphate oxidase family protein [Campylobacter anatolicus]